MEENGRVLRSVDRSLLCLNEDFPPSGIATPSLGSKKGCREHRPPGSDNWGDYLRVRPHFPAGLASITGGFTSVKKGGNAFNRARDDWSMKRWGDQPRAPTRRKNGPRIRRKRLPADRRQIRYMTEARQTRLAGAQSLLIAKKPE